MYLQRKKNDWLKIKRKAFPPCPYPDLDCELSMAGTCCWECENLIICKKPCQNNTADEPKGCGRYMKGKKRNVE